MPQKICIYGYVGSQIKNIMMGRACSSDINGSINSLLRDLHVVLELYPPLIMVVCLSKNVEAFKKNTPENNNTLQLCI
jgi:hypothetical protein